MRVGFYLKRLIDCYGVRRTLAGLRYRGDHRGTVVFNVVGAYLGDLHAEHFLAHLLARAGFRVKLLMDDFQLEHWEYILQRERDDDYLVHKTLKNRILRGGFGMVSNLVFAHPNIEVIRYSTMLAKVPDPVELAQSDRDHAEASVRKYYQGGEMDLSQPGQRRFYEVSLRNCEVSKKVGLYIERFIDPDLYLCSHYFYSAWGPAYDYLRSRGYTCLLILLSSYRPQSVHLLQTNMQTMADEPAWRRFSERVLDPEQRERIESYYEERFAARALDTRFLLEGTEQAEPPRIETGSASHVFGIFPGVIWDGDIVGRNIAFRGPVDWIVQTIGFFEKRPDLHLIVRFHPAEAATVTYSRRLEPFIRARIPHLDRIPNVTVIPSELKVRSYDLIRETIDIGLVFEGMLGMEMPFLGTPSILAAKARYYRMGVAFEPQTRDEYFALLSSPADVISRFEKGPYRENMLKFAYWSLFDICFSLPIYDVSSRGSGNIDFDLKVEVIDPARNPALARTIDYIASFVPPSQTL